MKLTALGTDINVDLRTIALTTPIWLPFLQIYVFIMKEKRKILRVVASKLIREIPREKRYVIDQLSFFSPPSAFVKYPEIFADRIFYCAASVWFIRSLIESGQSVQHATSEAPSKMALAIIIQLVMASLIYSSAFASGIGQRMRSEAAKFFDKVIEPDLWSRSCNASLKLFIYLTVKLDARRLLLSGSLTVLSSLFLSTAVVGCDTRPHLSSPKNARLLEQPNVKVEAEQPLPGYQMLSDLADWPVTVKVVPKDATALRESSMQDVVGRWLYRYLLVVAIFSLGTFFPRFSRFLYPPWLVRFLRRICVVVSVYEICELANPFLLGSLVWVGVFAIAFVALVRARSRTAKVLSAPRQKRLIVALIPLVIADLICLCSFLVPIPDLSW